MKTIKINVYIKRFKKDDNLGYYFGIKSKGNTQTARIHLNTDQAVEEYASTFVHELGHFLCDYLTPQLRNITKTKLQLENDEKFCEDLEKAFKKLYKKWKNSGNK